MGKVSAAEFSIEMCVCVKIGEIFKHVEPKGKVSAENEDPELPTLIE